MKKIFMLSAVMLVVVSCQFTETMVLEENGSGRMSLSMDLSEMMAFGAEMSQDSTLVKQDTIIAFKDIFEEKKDSIAQLSKKEQQQLKAMENYKIHMISAPESNKMVVDLFVDFKDIAEANELMKGFQQTSNYIPGTKPDPDPEATETEPELIGVAYTFEKGVFTRDAYIKDKERHLAQIDSMKQTEAFMAEMVYKLKYTFPRRILMSNIEDATYSLDGKTIVIERRFIDYFKNPDVLDVRVELEN